MEEGKFFGKSGMGRWIERPELATKPNGRPATDSWLVADEEAV